MKITVPGMGPDGRVTQRTIPFVVGVLADLSSGRPAAGRKLGDCRFAPVDEAGFGPGRHDVGLELAGDGAAWHGIRYLASTLKSRPDIRIRIADVAKTELHRDFLRAAGSEPAWLHRRLIDDVYGPEDGEPFAVLIADYEFANDRGDLDLLNHLATVADAASVPVLAAAGPGMFGLESFRELAGIRSPGRMLAGADYARWRLFRESDLSRHVALTLPPARVRRPGVEDPPPSAARETGAGEAAAAQDVMSAAYLLGGRLAEQFSRDDWWTALNVSEGKFHFDQGVTRSGYGPGTVPVWAERELELSRAGFAVLSGDAADFAFHGPMTVQRPPDYESPEASKAGVAVCRLISVMAVSRMAHHIRKAAVHFAGWAPSPVDLEHMLDDWIGRYVRAVDPVSGAPVDRSRPLAEARISLPEADGRPGPCLVRAWLRFGLPDDAPFGTVNNRVTFVLPDVRWTGVLE